MTFLLTLLTFFVDGKPDVPAPSPVISGAITVPGEFEDAPASVGESLGLPRLTPSTWHASPSLMVAHPPVSTKTFDVFSPAVRPPQEFPGLIACDPVALVPCPSPEPPAVRHVSFMDSVLPQLASKDSYGDPAKAGSECSPKGIHSGDADCPKWAPHHAQPHAHQHGPAHPFSPFLHPPIRPPHFGQMPVAFAAPFAGGPKCPVGALCPVGAPCPVGASCPAIGNTTLFPGAKRVQHVVRATYDVPQQTAEALEPILKNSTGVMECSVDGDELTINATAPAQTAIARFLVTVVNQTRSIGKPAKSIDVNFTKPKCCNGECECKDKCKCCGGKKSAQAKDHTANADKWYKKYFLSEKARAIESNLGFDSPAKCATECPKAIKCPVAIDCPVTIDCPIVKQVKDAKGNVFSFCVGFNRSESCSKATQCSATSSCKDASPCTGEACKSAAPCTKPCETQAVVQWKSTTQSKPVKVSITASANGVLLKTSDGTQLQAKHIQLETNGVHRLEVRNGDAIFTMPKPQETKPFQGNGQEYRPNPSQTKPVKKSKPQTDSSPDPYAPIKRDGRTYLPTY